MSAAPALFRWMRPASTAGVSALQRRTSASIGLCWRAAHCAFIIARLSFRVEPYRPAAWLPSPHGQTIGARLLRRAKPPAFERIRIATPDGDFLDLDYPPSAAPESPLVVLFHGLEGSAR